MADLQTDGTRVFVPAIRVKSPSAVAAALQGIKSTIDQANVAVGLQKIAQHAASSWIEREQAHIIAARQQPLE